MTDSEKKCSGCVNFSNSSRLASNAHDVTIHRPFSWISSRISIYDPIKQGEYALSNSKAISPIVPGALSTDVNADAVQVSPLPLSEMGFIGEAQQQWAPLRRKYNPFLHRTDFDPDAPQLTSGDIPLSNSTALQPSSPEAPNSAGQFGQFAYVDEPFLSWDFSLRSADKRLLGSVNRNFSGFGREIFTDTGVYAFRMDAAAPAQEANPAVSKDGMHNGVADAPGMTLDQRAVMLATAVSTDFDYFSRRSGVGGGVGLWPLWLPGGGGVAASEEAGAQAGGVLGDSGESRDRPGEIGAIGAAAAFADGYVLFPDRGEQGPNQGPSQGSPAQQDPSSEEVWGSEKDPLDNQGGGQSGGGQSDGGSGFDDIDIGF